MSAKPRVSPTLPKNDEEAAQMVRQAVLDHISTLPPAARAATELYFRGVLPRVVVTPVALPDEAS